MGDDLLQILRDAPNDAALERISQIVNDRETVVLEAAQLFRPGDEVALASELEALVQQQQVLESEMQRLLEVLRQSCHKAGKARVNVQSARRLMDSSWRGRLVDKVL